MFLGAGVTALVESLLERGTEDDVSEAAAAIDQLAAVLTEPENFVLFDVALLRLRALLARARVTRPPTATSPTVQRDGHVIQFRRTPGAGEGFIAAL